MSNSQSLYYDSRHLNDPSLCVACDKRFQCYTSRKRSEDGYCNIDRFLKLPDGVVREVQIRKAKRQGHYFTE